MTPPKTPDCNHDATASFAAPSGSANWRVRPSWVGQSGTIYYALQQRRWWGWRTWHKNYTRTEAAQAIKQCEADWPNEKLTDGGPVSTDCK